MVSDSPITTCSVRARCSERFGSLAVNQMAPPQDWQRSTKPLTSTLPLLAGLLGALGGELRELSRVLNGHYLKTSDAIAATASTRAAPVSMTKNHPMIGVSQPGQIGHRIPLLIRVSDMPDSFPLRAHVGMQHPRVTVTPPVRLHPLHRSTRFFLRGVAGLAAETTGPWGVFRLAPQAAHQICCASFHSIAKPFLNCCTSVIGLPTRLVFS